MAVTTLEPTTGTVPTRRGPDSPRRRKVRRQAWLFMGLAHVLTLKQYLVGAFFAVLELLFLISLPQIVTNLANLVTLGEPALDVPVKERPNSLFMLVDGVITIALILLFVAVYYVSVRSALTQERAWPPDEPTPPRRRLRDTITGAAFPVLGLAPTVVLLIFFVVVPLVFSTLVAFTNYSAPDHIPPAKTIDWVGLDTFVYMFGGSATWTAALARVFTWTIVWALAATVTCYFGGMLIAVLLTENRFRVTPLLRAIFILPYAIPSVVSLLYWQNALNGAFGTVNRTLLALGLIDSPIPWLSDAWLAKFTVVTINLWAGFPYFMLLIIGTMTSISKDVLEAAEVDGASKVSRFRHIVLPLVMYQTAPLMILSFAHNLNNFGAIFFLTGGDPAVADTTTTGAGGTDIMVSWIYKLTITLLKYNQASVLAVMIFVVLAPFAIFQFQRTKSYREGEL
ncbi:MAG: sugar ABC transporter permease [Propionicimonas sp.]|nr:sugar ABC transporter permease [Propionicimonas sp.]